MEQLNHRQFMHINVFPPMKTVVNGLDHQKLHT
jgi:hypothetical protein